MKAIKLSIFDLLNESSALIRQIAAPWLGVAWFLSMPLRLMQAYWLQELSQLGASAHRYGNYLGELALYLLFTLFLAVYGRSVFVRACNLAPPSGGPPGLAAFKVPLRDYATHLYLVLLIEVFWHMLFMMVLPMPYLACLVPLAAAIAFNVQAPGVLAPLKELFHFGTSVGPLMGLAMFFGAALLIVWINFYFAALGMIYLAKGFAGVDTSQWEHLLRAYKYVPILPVEFLPKTLLFVAAVLILEPFWIAAHVLLVRSLRARQSGEDLKLWFEELRRKAA